MKNWERYIKLHKISKEIGTFGLPKISMCVVIPCYNEPDIMDTVHALEGCDNPDKNIAVIVVVNSGENTSNEIVRQNRKTYSDLIAHANQSTKKNITLIPLYFDGIVRKHAGAGYARKLGMDYAIWIFYTQKNKRGIISSLDADCTVDSSYINAIFEAYTEKQLGIATHFFEHSIEKEQTAIIQYELYLRYFKWALYFCGFPYAIHTVGSCFSVLADVYVRHGGMNRRQGGEDFYFLHKIVPNEKFAEINTTTINPSSRMSSRVPFGTGPAIRQISLQNREYEIYSLQSFIHLKEFFSGVESLYKAGIEQVQQYVLLQPEALKLFLIKEGFVNWVEEINNNVSTYEAFTKRFYLKFSAFKIVQFLNEAHQSFYEKQPVSKEAKMLLNSLNVTDTNDSMYQLIQSFRKLDKGIIQLED